MKKIAMLLALMLCVMMAGTAMAAESIDARETEVPADGSDGRTYTLRIAPYRTYYAFLTDEFRNDIKEHIKKTFGSENYKYMYFDAWSLDEGEEIEVPHRVDKLTKEFDASFFGERGIEQFMAFYYNGSKVEDYEAGKLADYTTAVVDGKKKVRVVFDHLTPVVFAWIPGEPEYGPAVAAPLQAPDMPNTGDNSSLPGLFILLGMSAAAFGAMKMRRREN